MNKTTLASAIAFRHGLSTAEAARIVDTAIELIGHMLVEQGRVNLNGFGRFTVRAKAAREARNPRTGAPIHVPERRVVAFAPAKALRDRVNRPG